MGTNNDDKSLGYFMGRVDNQLGQIIERLEEMKTSLKDVAHEQTNHSKQLGTLEERVSILEQWKEKQPESTDFVRWSNLREKVTVPIIVSMIIFLLTTVGPLVYGLLSK